MRKLALALVVSAAAIFTVTPSAATAESGQVVAWENCSAWGVNVVLATGVTADRTVNVVSTIPSTTGFTGHRYTTTGSMVIWTFTDPVPTRTGTVTLQIYSNGTLEFTTSGSTAPAANCKTAAAAPAMPGTGAGIPPQP